MAKESMQGNISQEQLAAILAALVQNSQKQSDLLDKQLRESDERESEKKEKIRVEEEQRKQGALNQQKRRDEELLRQSNCAHIKPNRATALAGQRDHSGHIHYICQMCSKLWEAGESPHQSLIPDSLFIGGPIH